VSGPANGQVTYQAAGPSYCCRAAVEPQLVRIDIKMGADSGDNVNNRHGSRQPGCKLQLASQRIDEGAAAKLIHLQKLHFRLEYATVISTPLSILRIHQIMTIKMRHVKYLFFQSHSLLNQNNSRIILDG